MPSRLLSLLIAAIATHAAAFDYVINIPPATSLAGLQSNTQVNVLDGANLSSLDIPTGLTGVAVNVEGGYVAAGLTLGSGSLRMTDGRLDGDYSVDGYGQNYAGGLKIQPGGSAIIEGGSLAGALNAGSLSVSGGYFDFLWNDSDLANVITGGHLRRIYNTGNLDIYGGRIGSLDSDIGEPFHLHGQFFLNGQSVDGPTPIPDGSFLTGVLTDGTPVAFSPNLGDDFRPEGVTIVSAPIPPATPAVLNAPFDAIPNGIRDGQLLTLAPGADAGHDFVSLGATLNISGGVVGDDAVVVGGMTLLSSGSIGRQFTAIDDAVVVVSSGSIGPSTGGSTNVTSILRGSSLSVIGGSIPGRVTVGADSSIDVNGGAINQVRPLGASTVRIGGESQIESIVNTTPPSDFGSGRIEMTINGGKVGHVALRSTNLVMTGGEAGSLSLTEESTAFVHGGELNVLAAGQDTTIVVTNGQVNEALYASSTDPSRPALIQFRGGVASDISAVGTSSTVQLDGGLVRSGAYVTQGTLHLHDGRVENGGHSPGNLDRNQIRSKGVVNLSGAEVRGGFVIERGDSAGVGSKLSVTGGVFGRTNHAEINSSVKLHGFEFFLNGEAVSGQVNPTGDYVLSGTLSDGSVVILSSATSDVFAAGTLELVPTAVPAAASVINSPSDPAPRGIRAGQTLNLGDGVSIGYHFAGVDATLNMTGGSIDYGMELLGSQANLQGGTVGDALFAHAGSIVNIAGAVVGDYAWFSPGSVLNLTHGKIGNSSTFEPSSNLLMSGGATGIEMGIFGQAVITGGVVGRRLSMQTGSSLELRGGEFRLNGNPVSGSTTFISGDVLTGVLSDGTPVLFGVGDSLRTFTITETAIPDASATPIVSPASPTPLGLRNGQSLTLQSGAATGNDFTSLGATIVVDGGQIARRLEAHNSRIDLRDGSIDAEATLYGNSELVVRGGSTGANLAVRSGARLSQIGGEVGTIALSAGATLNVAGGDFGGQPADLAGQDFWSPAGSTINLFGLSFTQSSVDLLAGVGLGESVVVTNKGAALDGVLADGSEFGLVVGGRGRIIGNGTFTLTKLLLGDFNHDGVVDAADYSVWRDTEGSEVAAGTGADHDFDGVVTSNDHEVWAANYGRTFATLASVSVPEPSAAGLAVLAAVLGRGGRSSRRWRA